MFFSCPVVLVVRQEGLTGAVTSSWGGATGEAGAGGRRSVSAPGGRKQQKEKPARSKKEERREKKERGYQKAYPGERIPESVSQKAHHFRILDSSTEKRNGKIVSYNTYHPVTCDSYG